MKKLLFSGIILASILLFAASCQYKFVVEPEPLPPGDTVSFSLDVVPIWNDNGNCVSCHTSGNQRPDLTPDNAFSEIMNMGLVNTADPAASEIYEHPHPDSDGHSWKKYTNAQAAVVLQWIEQGAKDN
ncbi:MAG: hypothetical protein L3J66_07605 [Bacteroidales bacterium]|nr:hypothetical protein [Bacteroidales bacterium]